MTKTELNDLGNTPAAQEQMDALADQHDTEIELSDADLQMDETELEQVLTETTATVEQASQETQAATAAAQEQSPRPKPRPLTVTQEAAVTSLNEMTEMLGKYDLCRGAVERIGIEMRDLRIALDSFEPTQLIETTVAGIRIPMTATAVLEAKRIELARAMDYMRELNVRTNERAEALAEASYLDATAERNVSLIPPRRPTTRGPIITERAPDAPRPKTEEEIGAELEAGIRETIKPSIPREQLPDEDAIPAFLSKQRSDDRFDDEPRGLFNRVKAGLTGRNSG